MPSLIKHSSSTILLRISDVLDLPSDNSSMPCATVISSCSKTNAKILFCDSTVFSFTSGFASGFQTQPGQLLNPAPPLFYEFSFLKNAGNDLIAHFRATVENLIQRDAPWECARRSDLNPGIINGNF